MTKPPIEKADDDARDHEMRKSGDDDHGRGDPGSSVGTTTQPDPITGRDPDDHPH
jgi:hypothetical protein